jgi:geranylgeranyl diphosphate synthase, type II
VPAIEDYLDRYCSSLELPESLVEAIRYALLGGGKRLRPVLAWACCEALGGSGEASLPAAAAVELIHAFSLVHDDLPAMDDDDLRRGRPTLHIHAGEAMAILAGDAMMALAFELLVERTPDSSLAAALVRELSVATTGMIAGQVYDSLGGLPPGLSERERLELIHRSKTGALIRAACRMGALAGSRIADRGSRIAGSIPNPQSQIPNLDAVTAYAERIGLAFQITDDLLDLHATPEQAGKRTRKDAAAGKITYPALLGADMSRREVARLTQEAIAAVSSLPHPESLIQLAQYMSARTS